MHLQNRNFIKKSNNEEYNQEQIICVSQTSLISLCSNYAPKINLRA